MLAHLRWLGAEQWSCSRFTGLIARLGIIMGGALPQLGGAGTATLTFEPRSPCLVKL